MCHFHPMSCCTSSHLIMNCPVMLIVFSQRISAADALCHPWLTVEAPLPTSMDMMPRVKPDSQDVEENAEEAEREKKRKILELSSHF